jgi:hypothetical protein
MPSRTARNEMMGHPENWFIFWGCRQHGVGVCLGVQPAQSTSRAMLVAQANKYYRRRTQR